MKITTTGSLGNIGKPLVRDLVQNGHHVTVISSDAKKQEEIETLAANAAIGKLEDAGFLAAIFNGSDAVFVMEPPVDFFDHQLDIKAYYSKLGHNFVNAIMQTGVKRVVHLSSIGGHTDKGTGILHFHHLVETILTGLPSEITLTHVRPLAFYYNLEGFIPAIKNAGLISANYGGDDMISWASPVDIAAVVAEELTSPTVNQKIRYVVSDELTCNETAGILGASIGKPDLKWIVISDEEMQTRLVRIGMAPDLAAGLTEMNAAMHSGKLFEDYYRNKPKAFGKVKMTDYAVEFQKAYNSKN
jgi:uncharacterized protein YbjT (DUF2867 family)